jgi:hypothetical protein
MVSRIAVVGWAIFMGVIMCIAQVAAINVNWLINIIGVFCGGAVWPLISLIFWDRATGKAAISGALCFFPGAQCCIPCMLVLTGATCAAAAAVIGSSSGITAWLVSTQLTQGSLTILNTEANGPLLAGNVISNVLSLILVVSISLCFPEGRFDWNILKEKITAADEEVGWRSFHSSAAEAHAGTCMHVLWLQAHASARIAAHACAAPKLLHATMKDSAVLSTLLASYRWSRAGTSPPQRRRPPTQRRLPACASRSG